MYYSKAKVSKGISFRF